MEPEPLVLRDLEIIENRFNDILKNPEVFFKSQPENTKSLKELSQKSYNIASSDNIFKGKSLSKLFIHGFDEEQIWQQSDLANKSAASSFSDFVHSFDPKEFVSLISKNSSANLQLAVEKKHPFDNKIEHEDENGVSSNTASSEESSNEEGYDFDDDSDTPNIAKDPSSNKNVKLIKSTEKTPKYKSVVDDRFFKLSKLENFLRLEDLKEERVEAISSSSDDDDDIDLFQDIPSDDIGDSDEESDDENNETKKSSRDFKYEDFFDDPESEVGDESDNENEFDETVMKEHAGNELDSEIELSKGEEKDSSIVSKSTDSNLSKQKTAFELEQEKTKKKFEEWENSLLQPQPWHLTGEVAASSRPIDSLMYLDTDFDSNAKQDLLVDKTLTERVEEITIMAIRNKAFFDVERKYKPTEEDISYRKETALERTKSKKSLAEVYEEDYLKKQNKQLQDGEEDPKHKEIKKLMDSLLPQLHSLFSYIPKPAIPEIKVVSNLPAITVEEVAPTSVSDATLLAPEEVKRKSGLVKGQTERTDTDRKRERRKKKIHQKLKEKKRLEKLESQKGNPSAKVSKLEKLQTLKKLKQHKNTKIASIDEGGKIKSSTDFFSRLQDTVDTKKKTENFSKKKKVK